ncbi:MAG: glycogen-binding domain-containing protein [Blastocatellia bacterium]
MMKTVRRACNHSQTLFAREGDEWACRINSLPGRYTYEFVVDGTWMTDPINPLDEDGGNGNINSVPVVKLQWRRVPAGQLSAAARGGH